MATDPKKNLSQDEANEPYNVLSDPDLGFTPVINNRPVGALVRRDPPGGVLEETGFLQLNAEASTMVDEIMVAWGIDVQLGCLFYGANRETRTVAAVPIEAGKQGASRVVRYGDRPAHTLHIANVLAEHPTLRPTGKQNVSIVKKTLKNGKPYMIIDLNNGVTVNTTTRPGSKEHQKRQEAKAKREARKKEKELEE